MEREVMQGNAVPLFVGAWLVLVAVYFIIRGRIRTHSFFGKIEFSRTENPLGFWLAIGFVLCLAFTSIAVSLFRNH